VVGQDEAYQGPMVPWQLHFKNGSENWLKYHMNTQ